MDHAHDPVRVALKLLLEPLWRQLQASRDAAHDRAAQAAHVVHILLQGLREGGSIFRPLVAAVQGARAHAPVRRHL